MISLKVPSGFLNPVPSTWSEDDHARVLEIGCDAVRRLKTRPETTERTLEIVRRVVGEARVQECEILREEVERLRRAQAAHEADLARAELENERAVRRAAETSRDEAERACAHREQVLKESLSAAREALEDSRRSRDGAAEEIASLREESSRMSSELARLRGSNERGADVEEEHRDALRSAGFWVVDTSKGSHNTHFHDTLVASEPLRRVEDAYETDATVVCSVESKGHRSSKNLSREVERFAEVRSTMLSEGRARCFVFAATASIPCRNHERRGFDIRQMEDGGFSVTGWFGCAGGSSSDVVDTVRATITMQLKLNELRRKLPLDGQTLQRLVHSSHRLLDALKEQLARADALSQTARDLDRQTKEIRYHSLEMLLRQFDVLDANSLANSDGLEDVVRAHASLREGTRGANTKSNLIRDQTEFGRLRKRTKW